MKLDIILNMRGYALSLLQAGVIVSLYEGPRYRADLARLLETDDPSVSRAADTLTEKGLVEKKYKIEKAGKATKTALFVLTEKGMSIFQ